MPLTPAAALKLYMNQMTLYEQGEILDFPQVPSAKKRGGQSKTQPERGRERNAGCWIICGESQQYTQHTHKDTGTFIDTRRWRGATLRIQKGGSR